MESTGCRYKFPTKTTGVGESGGRAEELKSQGIFVGYSKLGSLLLKAPRALTD